jgi:hypothetical protein
MICHRRRINASWRNGGGEAGGGRPLCLCVCVACLRACVGFGGRGASALRLLAVHTA